MPEALALLLRGLAIGIGATATMDIVGVVASLAFGGALPDYALVGRWIGHMASARLPLRHRTFRVNSS